MKKKDIAFIKIIQLIGKKKKIKMGDEEGIYDSFDIKADENGNYKKDSNNPLSQRSLLRYVEELCEIGIVKYEGEGQNKYYSINEDKYIYDLRKEKNSISNLLKILIEKKEMELFGELTKVLNYHNSYNEKEIDKLLKRIKTPYEDYEVNKEIENKIKIAICESRNIEIKYTRQTCSITPIAIVKGGNTSRKYLFYLRKNKMGQPFEMSNIKEVTLLDINNIDKDEYLDNISNRWDIDGGAKFNVKVLFFDNDIEVIKKIRQDLNNRRSNYEFNKVENGYIYKDTIEGISDFKAWLRNYNDISVVLEPKALYEEIIHRNMDKLSRYGVAENEI